MQFLKKKLWYSQSPTVRTAIWLKRQVPYFIFIRYFHSSGGFWKYFLWLTLHFYLIEYYDFISIRGQSPLTQLAILRTNLPISYNLVINSLCLFSDNNKDYFYLNLEFTWLVVLYRFYTYNLLNEPKVHCFPMNAIYLSFWKYIFFLLYVIEVIGKSRFRDCSLKSLFWHEIFLNTNLFPWSPNFFAFITF